MNSIKQTVLIFSILLTLILMFGACKTHKSIYPKGFINDFMGIEGIQCTETIIPDAIDSKIGTINCEKISFTYDYGLFSNPGPLTPEEEFTRSFDSYHHVKFFENRMIDPKVYKIFLDSVQVLDVRKKMNTDKLMFSCDPCNCVAQLTFLGETYYYPLTLGENQLDVGGSIILFEERGDYMYKYYQVDGSYSGLYLSPKKNRYKTKNTLSLVVSETTLPQSKVDDILKKVYLVNN